MLHFDEFATFTKWNMKNTSVRRAIVKSRSHPGNVAYIRVCFSFFLERKDAGKCGLVEVILNWRKIEEEKDVGKHLITYNG